MVWRHAQRWQSRRPAESGGLLHARPESVTEQACSGAAGDSNSVAAAAAQPNTSTTPRYASQSGHADRQQGPSPASGQVWPWISSCAQARSLVRHVRAQVIAPTALRPTGTPAYGGSRTSASLLRASRALQLWRPGSRKPCLCAGSAAVPRHPHSSFNDRDYSQITRSSRRLLRCLRHAAPPLTLHTATQGLCSRCSHTSPGFRWSGDMRELSLPPQSGLLLGSGTVRVSLLRSLPKV